MTAYLLLNHLFNLLAPAAAMALLMVGLTSITRRGSTGPNRAQPSIVVRWAVFFVINTMVLVAGLLVLGHDGKMATYALLVVSSAVTHALIHKR